MSCLLPADCLNEIFESLEDDKITLRSCLLVSRFWCKISVRILWRDVWNFKHIHRSEVASAILGTLISCLPNESKDLLHKNKIFISTPTSKQPLFNYAAFCRVLSINMIYQIITEVLRNDPSFTLLKLKESKDRHCLVAKEILKMFMNQIPSLKSLYYLKNHGIEISNNITFTQFPGAKNCLTDLSELYCSSNIHSKFFYELSQICHNLRSLTIYFKSNVSDSLKELVSSQNNLKNLILSANDRNGWADLVPALTKHSNTLTKLHVYGSYVNRSPLSFVSSFLNLQEIKFSADGTQIEDFKKLQHITFPKLQILKIPYQCPKSEYMTRFLEINGKNLRELYIDDDASNLSIDKFCPNLRKLFVIFNYGELDILKNIFDSCKYLEGIIIWCGDFFLDEKELIETVAKYSPESFYELKIHESNLIPEDMESFLISWKNRTSKKSLSLIIVDDYNNWETKDEYMKVIEKYKNLGVIKKFETRQYYEEELFLF